MFNIFQGHQATLVSVACLSLRRWAKRSGWQQLMTIPKTWSTLIGKNFLWQKQAPFFKSWPLFGRKAKKLGTAELISLELYKFSLTLKAPNQNCSRRRFIYLFIFYFYLSKNIRQVFHLNPSRGFTWNIKSYCLWKTMKNVFRLMQCEWRSESKNQTGQQIM